ncbi:MAG: class II aldolase/adducin family protein [Candidatus Omnitrophica bacterium]|nr:class II aldolase/adducin family protein [Candidatus Omnitrophota bacterium]
MSEKNVSEMKRNIVAIGRLLWEKELVSGLNGNISSRIDDRSLILTATKTCLGLLKDNDILHLTLDGEMLEEGEVSTEKLMHTAIYKEFPDVQAIIHTHTPLTNGYFLEHEKLTPRIFESKIYLGEVKSVNQSTPSVTDINPVVGMLKSNSIGVLRQHGVLSIGKNLFDCFLLVQALEEAIKVEMVSRLFSTNNGSNVQTFVASDDERKSTSKKYKMFSAQQMQEIVRIVNADEQMKTLGAKTQMVMELAIKMDETGELYSFQFDHGMIKNVGQNADAEFLVSAPQSVWRAVFNREVDPFVATTQKKMQLRGDFARISKWYAPCNRVFELWTRVPIE